MTNKSRPKDVKTKSMKPSTYRVIKKRRQARKYLPSVQVLRWFVEILLAMKYLHEKKILHRDLKSQNIFLTANNEVRVGDFGIAKALDATSAFAGTIIGTPYYLSPEICSEIPYNSASDVWALGCLLFEMATLDVPFLARDVTALKQVITSDYPATLQLPREYPQDVQDVLTGIFSKDWRDRPTVEAILKIETCQTVIKMIYDEKKLEVMSPADMPPKPLEESHAESPEALPEGSPTESSFSHAPFESSDLSGTLNSSEAPDSSSCDPSQVGGGRYGAVSPNSVPYDDEPPNFISTIREEDESVGNEAHMTDTTVTMKRSRPTTRESIHRSTETRQKRRSWFGRLFRRALWA